MVFVDVGCGDGFFSILAAKKVGAKGRVYAVDIDPLGIEKLKDGGVDRLYLYQFPKKDFVGEIRTDAKKFEVLEAIKLTNGSGTFNRYELK